VEIFFAPMKMETALYT